MLSTMHECGNAIMHEWKNVCIQECENREMKIKTVKYQISGYKKQINHKFKSPIFKNPRYPKFGISKI
jgi:hypothetical protein